jgi:hypothetical protein
MPKLTITKTKCPPKVGVCQVYGYKVEREGKTQIKRIEIVLDIENAYPQVIVTSVDGVTQYIATDITVIAEDEQEVLENQKKIFQQQEVESQAIEALKAVLDSKEV